MLIMDLIRYIWLWIGKIMVDVVKLSNEIDWIVLCNIDINREKK